MKKLYFLTMILIAITLLCGCGNKSGSPSPLEEKAKNRLPAMTESIMKDAALTSFLYSDINTVYIDDSLCVLNYFVTAKDNESELKRKMEYVLINIPNLGYYEMAFSIDKIDEPHPESVMVLKETLDKDKQLQNKISVLHQGVSMMAILRGRKVL